MRRAPPSGEFAEMVRTVCDPAGIAVGVAAVLVAYPVWMMLAGPQHFTGSTWPAMNPYHNDLLSFVVPGPLQRVSLGMRSLGTLLAYGRRSAGGRRLHRCPALDRCGILAWRSRRSPRMQLAVVLLLGAALLSLGPYLAVDGRLTHVPLPFLLLDHLPLLNDILPSRICFEVGACLAAVIAFGLDDMHRAPARSKQSSSARRQWARGRGVHLCRHDPCDPGRHPTASVAGQPICGTPACCATDEHYNEPFQWETRLPSRTRTPRRTQCSRCSGRSKTTSNSASRGIRLSPKFQRPADRRPERHEPLRLAAVSRWPRAFHRFASLRAAIAGQLPSWWLPPDPRCPGTTLGWSLLTAQ